jgi:hypothetical protein
MLGRQYSSTTSIQASGEIDTYGNIICYRITIFLYRAANGYGQWEWAFLGYIVRHMSLFGSHLRMTVPTAATNHECENMLREYLLGICISSNVGVAITFDDDEEESIDGFMVTAEFLRIDGAAVTLM